MHTVPAAGFLRTWHAHGMQDRVLACVQKAVNDNLQTMSKVHLTGRHLPLLLTRQMLHMLPMLHTVCHVMIHLTCLLTCLLTSWQL